MNRPLSSHPPPLHGSRFGSLICTRVLRFVHIRTHEIRSPDVELVTAGLLKVSLSAYPVLDDAAGTRAERFGKPRLEIGEDNGLRAMNTLLFGPPNALTSMCI